MEEVSPPAAPTLFEWAGGANAIRRLMDAFYDRVEQDDLLSPFFPGGVSEEISSSRAASRSSAAVRYVGRGHLG
jgi:truncated hemoglobin YjbI